MWIVSFVLFMAGIAFLAIAVFGIALFHSGVEHIRQFPGESHALLPGVILIPTALAIGILLITLAAR